MSAADSTRTDANGCFVCGPDNPRGLQLTFSLADGRCTGEFTSLVEHAGFDGVTHGGIVFAVLDDAMANWFFLQGARGFTAKSEIRYRLAMPIGATASIQCELLKRKGRLIQLKAHARDVDTAANFAESEASFMLDDFGNLAAG
jgi:hypothetical protein